MFLSALLTGLNLYNKLARFGGAGTLVPITGFANAVVSPAIDFRSEGFVTGMAAKMFLIAGPVIVFGTLASVIYGVVRSQRSAEAGMPCRPALGILHPPRASYILNISDLKSQKTAPALCSAGADLVSRGLQVLLPKTVEVAVGINDLSQHLALRRVNGLGASSRVEPVVRASRSVSHHHPLDKVLGGHGMGDRAPSPSPDCPHVTTQARASPKAGVSDTASSTCISSP